MTLKEKNKKEETKELYWKAAEFHHHSRGPLWYFLVVFIAVLLSATAFLKGNFFFGVFIVLAMIVMFSLGRKRPRVIDFRINNKGVAIGDEIFYPYDELEGFSLLEHHHKLNEIILHRKTSLAPIVRVPIDSQLMIKAKMMLSKHLKEVKYEESLIDIFADLLKF